MIRRFMTGRFRWFVAGLLFLAITINYLDRQILALLKPILDRELGWSNEAFGLVNAAFFGTYAFSYLVFGWFIDRVGVKIGLAVSIVWWSLAAMGHAFAGSVRSFVVARVALGAGEGGAFPAAVKTSALWFPANERALAASIFNCGANMGPILAPAIIPWIAYHYGWRAAFVFAGVCGLLWLLLWVPWYTDDPRDNRNVTADEDRAIALGRIPKARPAARLPWRALFKYRATWAIVLARFITDPVSWFFLIWLPDFFKKTRGLELKQSWVHLMTIYATATGVALLAGWLAGRLLRSGLSITVSRKLALLTFACCVFPIWFVTGASDWQAVLLIGVAAGSHHGWSAILYATVSDLFPQEAVGAVTGLAGLAGAVGGMLFPPFAGMLLDHFGATTQGGTQAYGVLFALCSGAYLVAFVINHLLAPRFEQVVPPAAAHTS